MNADSTASPTVVLVALGSNLGDSLAVVRGAFDRLDGLSVSPVARSHGLGPLLQLLREMLQAPPGHCAFEVQNVQTLPRPIDGSQSPQNAPCVEH